MAKKDVDDNRRLSAAEEAKRFAEIMEAKRKLRDAERMQQERIRLGTGDADARLFSEAVALRRKMREAGVLEEVAPAGTLLVSAPQDIGFAGISNFDLPQDHGIPEPEIQPEFSVEEPFPIQEDQESDSAFAEAETPLVQDIPSDTPTIEHFGTVEDTGSEAGEPATFSAADTFQEYPAPDTNGHIDEQEQAIEIVEISGNAGFSSFGDDSFEARPFVFSPPEERNEESGVLQDHEHETDLVTDSGTDYPEESHPGSDANAPLATQSEAGHGFSIVEDVSTPLYRDELPPEEQPHDVQASDEPPTETEEQDSQPHTTWGNGGPLTTTPIGERRRVRFDAAPWMEHHVAMRDAIKKHFDEKGEFSAFPYLEEVECALGFWLDRPKPSRTPKLNEFADLKKRHTRFHEIVDTLKAKNFVMSNVDNDIKEFARASNALTIALTAMKNAIGSHSAEFHPGSGNDAYEPKPHTGLDFRGKDWAQEHVTWRVCLIGHAKGEKCGRIHLLDDPKCCSLGKWIETSKMVGHNLDKEDYAELVKRHDNFHSVAGEIVHMIEEHYDPSDKLRDIIRATSSLSSIIARIDPESVL